ncbi:hypothetical protein [Cohnella hongkongensis]|uniref:DUF4367 domain-containing protein n=1 Tax=Cohnella hongkongensis TaxID=178337 RepID=A0ABV9FD35_9BACL
MRQTSKIMDDQELKAMEIRSGREIDVRDRVMERIAGRQGSRRRRGNFEFVRRPAAVVAFLVGVALLTSITGYAANQYLQLKNSRGEVVLRTKEQGKYNPYEAELSDRLGQEWEKLQPLLEPGELAAYYVKDAELDADRWNRIHFGYVPLPHDDYDAFLVQLRDTNGPALPQPGYVPEGYVFENASVQARYGPLPPSPEYETLVDELLAEAESAADNRKLFYRVLPWSEASGANLQYHKGEAVLNLFAYKSNGNSMLPLTPEMNAEKAVAGGTEMMIYESEEGGDARKYFRHRAIWYGTQAGAFYVIADDPKHPLDKQELIRIAESMIVQTERP